MAFTQTDKGRSFSIGPVKTQRVQFAAASGDTSATITFDNLSYVGSVSITCLQVLTLTYNGDNTVSITFTDPVATIVGTADGHGT